MVIYEHVKGILSVPCYLDNGDYAEYTLPVTAAPFHLVASARQNYPFSCT